MYYAQGTAGTLRLCLAQASHLTPQLSGLLLAACRGLLPLISQLYLSYISDISQIPVYLRSQVYLRSRYISDPGISQISGISQLYLSFINKIL